MRTLAKKTEKERRPYGRSPDVEFAPPEVKHVRYSILEKADEIALYYGFVPIVAPKVSKGDSLVAKLFKEIESPNAEGDFDLTTSVCLEEKISVLRTYIEMNLQVLPQPVMIYYKGSITNPVNRKKPRNLKQYGLEILGSPKSMAEAILIKSAMVILSEEGFTDLYVDVNSTGDKDSGARFLRELQNYYRKNIQALPAECRTTMRKDVLELLSCKHEKCAELAEAAPQSLSFLSESGRTHFKEVLEYLETLEIPYNINNRLIGKKCYGQTVFEIRSGDSCPLAIGMRYDNITKKIGLKKEIPAVGITIAFKPRNAPKPKKLKGIMMKKPKFYFVQLGFDAKLKSLKVLEMLREAKIPLYQSLSKDKIVGQLTSAENLKIPYAIIMGQKEALEDSVIVRHMETRSQETVKIDVLQKYLERIK